MKKRLILLFMLLNLILTTGCWDMLDINDRIFPYAVGYDFNEDGDKRYNITFSYPNISAMGPDAISEDLVFAITTRADSMFDARHKMTSRNRSPLYFKHLKVLILSEEVAQDEVSVKEIIDGIFRDFVTNNNVKILVSKLSAEELINETLGASRQLAIEGTIYSLLVNQQESVLFHPMDVMEFIENMDLANASTVPLISIDEDIDIEGSAVFKDYKLIGYLQPSEQRALNYINAEITVDSIETKYEDAHLSLMLTGINRKMRLEDSEENLKIKINLEAEGYIHQFTLDDKYKVHDEELLKKLQDAAAKEIKVDIDETIKKIQDMRADLIHAGPYLRMFNPDIWDEVEEDWDEIFRDIDIEVDVRVFIRRRGIIK